MGYQETTGIYKIIFELLSEPMSRNGYAKESKHLKLAIQPSNIFIYGF